MTTLLRALDRAARSSDGWRRRPGALRGPFSVLSRRGWQADRGFTLFELLVVIAVISLLATAVPGFLMKDNPGLDLERATRAITDGLREAQTNAIFENADQGFTLDVARRQFRSGHEAIPIQLSQDIEMDVVTSRQGHLGPMIGEILFHPDGSSSGGRIVLTVEKRRSVIDVDWLTGVVSVNDDEP